MRRRVDAPVLVPPAELTDYRRWCADRNVEAFGDPEDWRAQRAAADRWLVWRDERAAWCTEHGVDEYDTLGGCGMAPWLGVPCGQWRRLPGQDHSVCVEHGWRWEEH